MMKPACTNAKTVQRTMNTLYKRISKPFSFRLVPGSSLFCQKEISLPRTLPFFPIPPPPPPTQKDAIFSKKLAPVLQAKILTRNTFIAKPHEAVRASRMNLESRIQYCFGHLRGFAGKSLRGIGDRPLICHVVKTRVRDGTH